MLPPTPSEVLPHATGIEHLLKRPPKQKAAPPTTYLTVEIMRRFINGMGFYSLSVMFIFRDNFRAVTLPLLLGMALVFALFYALPLMKSLPLAIMVAVLQQSSFWQWSRADELRQRLEDVTEAECDDDEESE